METHGRIRPGPATSTAAVLACIAVALWACVPTRPMVRFVHVVQCANGDHAFSDNLRPVALTWKSEQDYLACQAAAPPVLEQAATRWSKTVDLQEIPACARGSAGSLQHGATVEQQPTLARCGGALVPVRLRLPRGDTTQHDVCIHPTFLSDTKPRKFDGGEWLLLEPRVDSRAPSEKAWRQRGRFETLHACAARRWELLQALERAPEAATGAGKTPAMECRCRPSPGV